MLSEYRGVGNEILNGLEIDPTRLGDALSTLSKVVRDCLKSGAWNEVPTYCESARKLCDEIQDTDELSDMDIFYAEGIFHAYEGISHLYQADEKARESEELAKAIKCLEESRQSFHAGYRDHWNEIVLHMNLGRLYRNQNKLSDALLAFQRSCKFSTFSRLSIQKMQEIVKVASEEIEKTRKLFRVLPIIDEIAAGREKPVSDDDIIGHIQQTDEFE